MNFALLSTKELLRCIVPLTNLEKALYRRLTVEAETVEEQAKLLKPLENEGITTLEEVEDLMAKRSEFKLFLESYGFTSVADAAKFMDEAGVGCGALFAPAAPTPLPQPQNAPTGAFDMSASLALGVPVPVSTKRHPYDGDME